MRLSKIIFAGSILGFVLFSGAIIVRAQDQPQPDTDTQPKPAARTTPFPVIDPSNTQDDDSSYTRLPDATPLTGAQIPTLGSSEARHSYWVPGAQLSTSIQSGQPGSSNSSWFAETYLMGNLSLLKVWSRSQLAFNYSGGGHFSSSSQQGNGWMQQFSLVQSFQWDRLSLQFIDQFAYLPQSQFGFGGGTSLGVPGAGGGVGPVIPGLGGNYLPNQSIYAALGPRYSNAGVIQATYTATSRGSITATGSYGILRFVDPGNVDSNSLTASLGYNYLLTRADTIGVFYSFNNFQYSGEPQAFAVQSVNAAYGRKITGRIALQASGGPQYTRFRIPVGTQTSKLGANFNVNATYSFENGGISLGFQHGVTGGSGVFTGSTVNSITFAFNRKISREWSGFANLGFAHNSAVVSSTTSAFPTYSSLFISLGASRPIGREFAFSASYTANISTTAQTTCPTGSCTSNQTYSYITLNLQWHPRPLIMP